MCIVWLSLAAETESHRRGARHGYLTIPQTAQRNRPAVARLRMIAPSYTAWSYVGKKLVAPEL
jgi:hypothetical protein